ncbi:17502_t:CDS:1, partial [Racocetra fulgida]
TDDHSETLQSKFKVNMTAMLLDSDSRESSILASYKGSIVSKTNDHS